VFFRGRIGLHLHTLKYIREGQKCMVKIFYIYYIHFEINGVSCNLIGSQECDFSTNRTAIRAEIALL
jgi:hypothetical protein